MKKKLLIISSIFIILDQILKIIVRSNIVLGKEIIIIPKFFYLTNVKNTGGAFSIFENNPLLLAMFGLIVLFLVYRFIKNKQLAFIEEVSYSLLIGGIIGNIIDRFIFNSVTDYIGIILGTYYYPIFNLADIGIVVSIFIIFFLELGSEKNGISSK